MTTDPGPFTRQGECQELASKPAQYLDLSVEFLDHCLNHWILHRDPGCRWCQEEGAPVW